MSSNVAVAIPRLVSLLPGIGILLLPLIFSAANAQSPAKPVTAADVRPLLAGKTWRCVVTGSDGKTSVSFYRFTKDFSRFGIVLTNRTNDAFEAFNLSHAIVGDGWRSGALVANHLSIALTDDSFGFVLNGPLGGLEEDVRTKKSYFIGKMYISKIEFGEVASVIELKTATSSEFDGLVTNTGTILEKANANLSQHARDPYPITCTLQGLNSEQAKRVVAASPDVAFIKEYEGQRPEELAKNPKIAAWIQGGLPGQFQHVLNNLAVSGDLDKDGDWLVGSGCAAHLCSEEEAMIAANERTGDLAVGLLTRSEVHTRRTGEHADLPKAFLEWQSEHAQKPAFEVCSLGHEECQRLGQIRGAELLLKQGKITTEQYNALVRQANGEH